MDGRTSSKQPTVTSIFLKANLHGGAPWGFSLKGGLEHGEPLTISKIEEGGKVDALECQLQVGDEVMIINDVELSSSRREAISLVKGSYKNLHMVVRRLILVSDNSSCLEKEKLTNNYSGETPENYSNYFEYDNVVEDLSAPLLHFVYIGNAFGRTEITNYETEKRSICLSTYSVEVPKLRLKNRQSVPRPHSWHSTKLLESQPNPSMMQISQGTLGSPWHQAYHSSSSAIDLSSYEHKYLRRSPEQYSSRGSMESLDHTSSTYQPCNLSSAKSTNCIDQLAHLHSKRDSAYSSFSTNASIPEYHPTTCKERERCNSMESMFSRGNLQEGIKHADIRYIKTVYDSQRGVSEEYEVNSSVVKNRGRPSSSYGRNNGGPLERSEQNRVLSESDIVDKSPPMPPTRSDSYAVTRHHERPSSWSSLEQNRHMRTNLKGPGTYSTNASYSNQQLKAMFSDGQLHTVQERSPECSPLMKPKQVYSQVPKPGQPMLPTGIYMVPPPEPHFAHVPQPPKNNNGSLYPALAKEGAHSSSPAGPGSKRGSRFESETTEKRNQVHKGSTAICLENQTRESGSTQYTHYKPHFSIGPENHANSYLNNENDKLPNPDTGIKTKVNQANGNIQLRIKNERSRSHPGSTFQNQGSYKKTKSDAPTIALGMETHRNHMSESNLDKNGGCLNSTDTKINASHEKRLSVNALNHINKAANPSFTKHIENADSSMLNATNHSVEMSSPFKNSSELQRRESLGSYQSNNNLTSAKPENKHRSSVLEKISQIELREQDQKFQGLPGNIYGHPSGQCTKGANRTSVNSIDELRNKFTSQEPAQSAEYKRLSGSHTTEKSYGMQQLQRSGSIYTSRSGNIQNEAVEKNVDSSQEKNNDQSIWQDMPGSHKPAASSHALPNKEDHWQSTAQDTLGFSRAYRNSIKDAQCKVLEATSYRRKDLEISPPQYKKTNVKRPTSAIVYGKTSPVSPHAPKERHSITPTENFARSQDLGQDGTSSPCQVTRIGARKRLTAEQKKRSYSEPEKMNEVGASDNESLTTSSQKKGQAISFLEQTVADRRRMFERDSKTCSTVNLSKPELKQLQQNALADYIERKTGRRPSPQEPGLLKERSQSTYFSGSMMDNKSISSTSSINSLQEHNISFCSRDPREPLSKTGRVSSTLPPGLTGLFDFERNTEHLENRDRTSLFVQQHLSLDFKSRKEDKNSPSRQKREITASKPTEFFVVSSDHKSVSTAPEQSLHDAQQSTTLHLRSRSSPATEKASQQVQLYSAQVFMMKEESPDNNAFHTSTSKERSSGNIMESDSEIAPFAPECQPHSTHHTEPQGQRINPSLNSIDQTAAKTTRHIRAQSAPHSSGRFSNAHNITMGTLMLSKNTSPAKMVQDSSGQPTQDLLSVEGSSGNRNLRLSSAEATDKIHADLGLHDNNSLDCNLEEIKKAAPPQRPPPPKMKCLNLAVDSNVLQNNTLSGQKASPSWKNNPKWSTSSSEPETPCPHGRVSLRISESALHFSSSVGNDEDDDEVFVKDKDLEALPEIPFDLPSPPLFPPPTLEDALLKESQEKKQGLPDTPPTNYEGQVTEDLGEISKYPSSRENLENMESTKDKCGLTIAATKVPVRDSELDQPSVSTTSQIPQSKASSVGVCVSSQRLQTQDEESSTVALEPSENTISDYLCAFSHARTSTLSPEEIKSQGLAKEITDKDKSLTDILDPEFKMKTTMDFMEGLFMSSTGDIRESSRRWIKTRMPSDDISSALSGKKEDKAYAAEHVVSSSGHFSLSASKAELLRKITDAHTRPREQHPDNVNEKKAEFISSLTHKLAMLRGAKESLVADMQLNNRFGEHVEAEIEGLCTANEFDKYKMFIGDLDKVVNLLLSLSGRMARVENVLHTLSDEANAEELNIWNEKKKQLSNQHEDARELKENLDRREKLVTNILGNYLTREQFQDYQHFVRMKSALLVEQRELDDKMKLCQEQLNCLLESLPRDFMDNRKVSSKDDSMSSSLGNVKMLPPMTTSL
ncbi:protein Shroom3 [Gastrophryne carolinensis]